MKTDRCVEDKKEKKSEQNFVAAADSSVKLAKKMEQSFLSDKPISLRLRYCKKTVKIAVLD